MQKIILLALFNLLVFVPALHAQNQSETKRFLYLSTPDAAQVEGMRLSISHNARPAPR